MKDSLLHIRQPDGTKREVDFEELTQLKKDILWIYDENFEQANAAFVPNGSFNLKYWEYLTLRDDLGLEELEFFKIGSLIIILCQCVEYIDIAGGNQNVFEKQEISLIIKYVEKFEPNDQPEMNLKLKILFGLNIAESITDEQLLNSDFEHELAGEFYENLSLMGNDFIGAYYDRKRNEKY